MGRPTKDPQRAEDTVPDLPAVAAEEVVFDPEATAAEASGSKAADIEDVDEVAPMTEVAKKPAKDTVVLTEEQEHDMVEWLSQNPLFYDKSMTSFREKAKKHALWVAKASEIGRSVAQVTAYEVQQAVDTGQVRRRCQGPHRPREVDSGELKRKIAASQLPPPEVPYPVPVPAAPVSAPLAPLDDDDSLETNVEDPLSRASTPLPSSQPQTTPLAPATTKRKRHSDDSTMARLEERARTSAVLQQEIRAHLREAAVPTCPRVAWGRWITALLPSIYDSIWSAFMRDSISLMMRYSDASQHLHHQPQVMVQQQMPAQMPVTAQQTMMAPLPPPAITPIYPATPLPAQLVWDSTTPTFGAPVATTVPQSTGGADNITPLTNISAFAGLSRLLGSFAADTVGMSSPNLPQADDDDDSGSQEY
uniref:uncharacterized protein n=1 Tax=Myxine glutinosa TaxID=7769 RepID=UPI00358F2F0F